MKNSKKPPAKRAQQKTAKRSTAERVSIFCTFDKMVAIDKLKANPANPNIHPAGQVDKLASLIAAHGWRHAITVSKRSNLIVSGHCRLAAAKKLGLVSCPVDFQAFRSAAEERAVLIADNVIAEFSETDVPKMSDLLIGLEEADYDLGLTAVDADQLDAILNGPTGTVGQEGEQATPVKRKKAQIEIYPGTKEDSRKKGWLFQYKGEIRFGGWGGAGGMTAARAFARKLAGLLKDEPEIVEK